MTETIQKATSLRDEHAAKSEDRASQLVNLVTGDLKRHNRAKNGLELVDVIQSIPSVQVVHVKENSFMNEGRWHRSRDLVIKEVLPGNRLLRSPQTLDALWTFFKSLKDKKGVNNLYAREQLNLRQPEVYQSLAEVSEIVVTEYLPETVDGMQKSGALSRPGMVLQAITQPGKALSELNKAGLIFGDFSSGNVGLALDTDPDGSAAINFKLFDFGSVQLTSDLPMVDEAQGINPMFGDQRNINQFSGEVTLKDENTDLFAYIVYSYMRLTQGLLPYMNYTNRNTFKMDSVEYYHNPQALMAERLKGTKYRTSLVAVFQHVTGQERDPEMFNILSQLDNLYATVIQPVGKGLAASEGLIGAFASTQEKLLQRLFRNVNFIKAFDALYFERYEIAQKSEVVVPRQPEPASESPTKESNKTLITKLITRIRGI